MRTVIEILKSIRLRDGLVMLLMLVGAFGFGKLFGPRIGLLLLMLGVGIYLIRDHVDWWSPQAQQVLAVALVAVFGVYLGRMIGTDKYWVVALLVGSIGLAVHFKRPEYMLLTVAILVPDMFSLIPADFLQVRGVFKLRDLLLLGIVSSVIVKELVQRRDIKFVFGSISSHGIIAFCFVVTLFIVFTSVRHSCPLSLSFRTGRDYFYYLFFFAVVHSVKGKREFDFVMKGMILFSVLFAVLYIAQALSGGALHIMRAMPLAERSIIFGVPLVRSYASFGFAEAVCFGLLGTVAFRDSRNKKLWTIIAVILILMAIFFTFGRTAWFRVIATTVLVFLFLPADKKRNFAPLLLLTVAGLILFLLLIGSIRYGTINVLLTGGIERAYSGITDVRQVSGTFGYRFDSLVMFYRTVISRNLLFGIGFLYPGSEATMIMPHQTVVWGESSLVSILNTMGISGIVLHASLTVVFAVRGFSILRQIDNRVYKGFIIGFMAWYIADWTGIFTTQNMISYCPITLKALAVGLTESMYRIGRKT